MSYLLDTCILSKLRKITKVPDPKLENWINSHNDHSYFISVLTMGEIQSGISKLNTMNIEEKKKRSLLENWFQETLVPFFHNRILPLDLEVVLTWGEFTGKAKQRGVIIPVVDGLMAATALVHHLTIVTENIDDFVETGAKLCNPWV